MKKSPPAPSMQIRWRCKLNKVTEDDFFDVEENAQAQDASVLNKKIREISEIQLEMDMCEERLSELKKSKNEILRHQLPSLMVEMGTHLAKDPETGFTIEIEKVASDLPKEAEERIKIYDALEPLGVSDILKSSVSIQTGPGSPEAEVFKMLLGSEENVLEEAYMNKIGIESSKIEDPDVIDAIETLRERFDFDNTKSKIEFAPHWATFRSWCKEQLEDVQHEQFFEKSGLWYGLQAKLKKGK